jgi:hypothetical protein
LYLPGRSGGIAGMKKCQFAGSIPDQMPMQRFLILAVAFAMICSPAVAADAEACQRNDLQDANKAEAFGQLLSTSKETDRSRSMPDIEILDFRRACRSTAIFFRLNRNDVFREVGLVDCNHWKEWDGRTSQYGIAIDALNPYLRC